MSSSTPKPLQIAQHRFDPHVHHLTRVGIFYTLRAEAVMGRSAEDFLFTTSFGLAQLSSPSESRSSPASPICVPAITGGIDWVSPRLKSALCLRSWRCSVACYGRARSGIRGGHGIRRLTTYTILLLIYFAYLMPRQGIEDPTSGRDSDRSTASSASISVPITYLLHLSVAHDPSGGIWQKRKSETKMSMEHQNASNLHLFTQHFFSLW